MYLDHWSICELAEGDSSRRKRFTNALQSGGDLLFSVTNAAELSGPQGRSSELIRTFLDEIGAHWFPVGLNPLEIVNRELRGAHPNCVPSSEELLKSYVTDRFRDYPPGSGKVIDLSESFFRLGAMVDWVVPQRESNLMASERFDTMLRKK